MVQEQRVSVSEKDNKFGDGFPETKNDASRELKNREMVGFWRFSKNDGVPRYVPGNQTATGRPVTPIVYGNAAKPNLSNSTVDDSADEMNEWKNSIRQRACDSTDAAGIFNNRTHWNMRCKFLEVGLRINGMDKIRENPDQIYEKPEGKFFIYVRRKRNEKKRNEEAKSNGYRPVVHVRKCSRSASSKSKVCLKVQNVISTGNATNMFIHKNKMDKNCTKEAKTNGFKPYDCATNGSQGESTMKDQSIESNFSPKKKDVEDARTNCVTNGSQGESTMKDQSIESNFSPKKKDVEDAKTNCVTNGSQGESTMKDQSIESNFSPYNKKDIEDAKTNGFKPYDCVTNGFQGDSTMKDQSIKSNFSPKKKDVEDAKTNGFKPYDCVTNGFQGDSTMKDQSIESNFCPKEKDHVENVEMKKERREKRKMSTNIENVEMKKKSLQEKQHSKSETCSRKVGDELVLEDIGDEDLVRLPEVVFVSPQRSTRSVEHAGNEEISCALSVRQHEVFQNDRHPTVEGPGTKVRVSLSRLERLRRRIANFFDRFRRNRVTPVDI